MCTGDENRVLSRAGHIASGEFGLRVGDFVVEEAVSDVRIGVTPTCGLRLGAELPLYLPPGLLWPGSGRY